MVKVTRRWAGLANTLGLVATLGLTGCVSGGLDCPAIGWANQLKITVDGNASRVADVMLCIDDDCAPSEVSSTANPLAMVQLVEHDRNTHTWVFSVGMSTPDELMVRATDTAGTVLSDTVISPDWVRVGGSEKCGGPGEAAVTVSL